MTSSFSVLEHQPASPDLDLFARLLDATGALRPLVAKRSRQIEQERRVSSGLSGAASRVAGMFAERAQLDVWQLARHSVPALHDLPKGEFSSDAQLLH
jgi:hypothetical protein